MKNQFKIKFVKKQESGQVVIGAVIFFLLISLAVMTAVAGPVAEQIRASGNYVKSAQSYVTAETLNNEALYRLNKGMSLPSTLSLSLNNSESSAVITDSGDTQEIVSEGTANNQFVRTVRSSFSQASGTSFHYGLQVGTGGIMLSGSSRIDGNVYSNGEIVGSSSAVITGTATAANNGEDFGIISGESKDNKLTIGGNAYAHNVNYSKVSGNLFCQSGIDNNKNCDTSQADPSPNACPISQSKIDGWKAEASGGVVKNGDLNLGGSTSTSTSGAMIIKGNLFVGGSAVLTINGTLYVTGNIKVDGSGKIQLGSSYGTNTGVIVVDGTTDIEGSGSITGNGQSGSYTLLVSTNTKCASADSCSNGYAIEASGAAGSVILVAQNGGISFLGSASAKSAVANFIIMEGSATIEYETGLINVNFQSGPSGTWAVDSWSEIAD